MTFNRSTPGSCRSRRAKPSAQRLYGRGQHRLHFFGRPLENNVPKPGFASQFHGVDHVDDIRVVLDLELGTHFNAEETILLKKALEVLARVPDVDGGIGAAGRVVRYLQDARISEALRAGKCVDAESIGRLEHEHDAYAVRLWTHFKLHVLGTTRCLESFERSIHFLLGERFAGFLREKGSHCFRVKIGLSGDLDFGDPLAFV